MNKLANLIGNAAHLATRIPNGEEILDWRGPMLAARLDAWLTAQASPGESVLLVDVPAAGFGVFADATSVTLLSSDEALDEAALPADWRVTRRHLRDIALDEATVLAAVRDAPSLRAVRDAFETQALIPWYATASVKRIVAPFLVNRGSGARIADALREAARVLEVTGSFETVVLAADEPLAPRSLTVAGARLSHFPVEAELARSFAEAGLHGLRLVPLLDGAVLTTGGVELRAFAASAYAGTEGVCLDQGDAAIYLGPWSSVSDDDGHTYPRGVRIAVCAKTAAVLRRTPYAGSFLVVPAHLPPPLEDAPSFDCSRDVARTPAETKGRVAASGSCGSDGKNPCGC
jgi:hypothetical protein